MPSILTTAFISIFFLISIEKSNAQANRQALSIDSLPYRCSDSFDVSVRMRMLNNVIGLQGSIRWDSAALSLSAIKPGTAIIALDSSNMNLTNAARGVLSFLWFDNSISGIDPADSSVLFTMKFLRKKSAIGKVSIDWSDQPTPREIDTLDFNNIPQKNNQALFNSGSIETTFEYVFTGNGNWSNINNWKDSKIPPSLLQECESITIKHISGGSCNLDVQQRMTNRSGLKVSPGCRLNISGYLQ